MNKESWLEEFGNNLRNVIQEEGITQKQLAKESNIDQADISRYVSGMQMPSAKAIVNLAHALNRDTDELINFDEMIED